MILTFGYKQSSWFHIVKVNTSYNRMIYNFNASAAVSRLILIPLVLLLIIKLFPDLSLSMFKLTL